MKHIKRFNEELKPSTYIDAGKKLKQKGHEDRGKKLIDYGSSKSDIPEFDFIIKWNSTLGVTSEHLPWDPTSSSFSSQIQTGSPTGGIIPYPQNVKITYGNGYLIARRGVGRGSKTGRAYVKTRGEALSLLKFLKNTNPLLKITVNDLYNDSIVTGGSNGSTGNTPLEMGRGPAIFANGKKSTIPGWHSRSNKPSGWKRFKNWATMLPIHLGAKVPTTNSRD